MTSFDLDRIFAACKSEEEITIPLPHYKGKKHWTRVGTAYLPQEEYEEQGKGRFPETSSQSETQKLR